MTSGGFGADVRPEDVPDDIRPIHRKTRSEEGLPRHRIGSSGPGPGRAGHAQPLGTAHAHLTNDASPRGPAQQRYSGQPRGNRPSGPVPRRGDQPSTLRAVPPCRNWRNRAPGMERLQDPLIILFATSPPTPSPCCCWGWPGGDPMPRIAFAVLFGWAAWYNASLA